MADQPAATPPPPPSRPALLRLYETNRPAAALLTLVVLEIVPVLGLIASAREGWDAWTTPAVGLAVAGLLGPLGILLGRGWGIIATSYVSWAGIVILVLHAMTLGFTPLRIAPAAAYAAVLATLSSLSRREDVDRKGSPVELPVGLWLKENVEAIIVAFIMALVIRCFGIEVFKIPSSSMEPTLLGDLSSKHSPHPGSCSFPNVHVTAGGDRIMVTKFFYAAADVERYDVVVFKFPLNQSRNFIKRVVGLPDEDFMLYHGNVFTRKPGETGFKIARRPLRTQDSLWIDPAGVKSFLDRWETFEKYWDVDGPKPAVASGELVYDAPPGGDGAKIRYKDAPRDPDLQAVSDLRISFEATLTSTQGEIFAEILNAYGRFELRLSTSDEGALKWFPTLDPTSQPATTESVGARLELDRRVRVELGVYDGLAYARVDGGLRKIEFITTQEAMGPLLLDAEPVLRFGGKGGAFRVRNLKVGRDVHYKQGKYTSRFEEKKPVKIRPGHYVVMGDNVTSSHDSRGWVKRGYSLQGRADVVEYEGQQEFDPDVTELSIQDRYGLKVTPTRLIADKYGRIWALYQDDPGPFPAGVPAGVIDDTRPIRDEDFYEIGEQYIVGKALWVWWPPGRWFKLIR